MDLLNLIRKWSRPRLSRHAIMHQSHFPKYPCRRSSYVRPISNFATLMLQGPWSRHSMCSGLRRMALAALFTVAMISCDENHNPTGPLPPLSVADFPTRVGTHWTYHVVDTISLKEDTVDVRITSERLDSTGARVTTWMYSSRNGAFQNDSAMMTILGDTICSFDFCCSGFPKQQTIFPIVSGTHWKYYSPLGLDSSSVLGAETVITPLRLFRTYPIETTTIAPYAIDHFNSFTSWVSKDYGCVRLTHTVGVYPGVLLYQVEIWELLAFES